MAGPPAAVPASPLDRLASLVRGLVFVLTSIMLAALALQIMMRYLLGQALSWTEEIALACFTWTILLAVALGVRDSIHVRMELLVDRLPGPARRIAEQAILLLVAALGAFLAWSGTRYVLDAQGATSAATGYPTGWLYAAAPVCGALIVLFAIEQIWLAGRRPPGMVQSPEDALRP
jgi:TRAP-type C4-dicarboxylate transport system permease small subunit